MAGEFLTSNREGWGIYCPRAMLLCYVCWLRKQDQHLSNSGVLVMKTFTWARNGGHVLVIPFANGITAGVSTKTFKTKRGALAFGDRIRTRCCHPITGKDWYRDLPFQTTDLESGEVTKHFTTEPVDTIR
jgi:hypothetical protein